MPTLPDRRVGAHQRRGRRPSGGAGPGWASSMPSTTSSTNAPGSLMIFFMTPSRRGRSGSARAGRSVRGTRGRRSSRPSSAGAGAPGRDHDRDQDHALGDGVLVGREPDRGEAAGDDLQGERGQHDAEDRCEPAGGVRAAEDGDDDDEQDVGRAVVGRRGGVAGEEQHAGEAAESPATDVGLHQHRALRSRSSAPRRGWPPPAGFHPTGVRLTNTPTTTATSRKMTKSTGIPATVCPRRPSTRARRRA